MTNYVYNLTEKNKEAKKLEKEIKSEKKAENINNEIMTNLQCFQDVLKKGKETFKFGSYRVEEERYVRKILNYVIDNPDSMGVEGKKF